MEDEAAVIDEVPPKTFTKQEIGTKTRSSVRTLTIPDYIFEAIQEARVMSNPIDISSYL